MALKADPATDPALLTAEPMNIPARFLRSDGPLSVSISRSSAAVFCSPSPSPHAPLAVDEGIWSAEGTGGGSVGGDTGNTEELILGR